MNVKATRYPLLGSIEYRSAHKILLGWDDGFGRPMPGLSVGILLCRIEVSSERDVLNNIGYHNSIFSLFRCP